MDSKEKKQQQVDELLDALKEWDQSADGITDNTGYLADTITLSSSSAYNYANTTVAANGPFTISAGTGTGTWATAATATSGKLTLLGDDADLVINGKSLTDTLQALEERLNILNPNPALEKEWNELKELGDRYRELEKDLQEKAKIWRALNK